MLSPCSKNPSWQPFTICFSNSFPASFAWTLLFSLAGFLSPSQTSWSLIYLCFCLQCPSHPDPASSPSQGCTSSRKCPWQNSVPQGALPPLSIAYIVFPTQQLLVPRILLFSRILFGLLVYFVSFLQATVLSHVFFICSAVPFRTVATLHIWLLSIENVARPVERCCKHKIHWASKTQYKRMN